jgi:hypothetical protein
MKSRATEAKQPSVTRSAFGLCSFNISLDPLRFGVQGLAARGQHFIDLSPLPHKLAAYLPRRRQYSFRDPLIHSCRADADVSAQRRHVLPGGDEIGMRLGRHARLSNVLRLRRGRLGIFRFCFSRLGFSTAARITAAV